MKNSIKDRAYWLDVWTRFNNGERAAFSEIYEEFIDSLFAYGYKISHDREMVKDCIQDIFLDLPWLHPNLKNPEYIEFYLFKSLKNAIFHKSQKERSYNPYLWKVVTIVTLNLRLNRMHPNWNQTFIVWRNSEARIVVPQVQFGHELSRNWTNAQYAGRYS